MATFDSQLERQLSSLFRAEAQDASLPPGTWQAINPRMGEPDTSSVLWQLLNGIELPRWRNPMNVKYVAPAATIALALIAALLFVLLVNGDDNQDQPVPATTPTVPATSMPEATATPIVATATPEPTNTPEPTVTPTPTETATPRPVPTPTPLPESKPVPAALRYDAEHLEPDEILPLWQDYFANTLVVGDHDWAVQVKFCGDGTGYTEWKNPVRYAGFEWELAHSGDEWNSVLPVLHMYGQDQSDPYQRNPLATFSVTEDGLTATGYRTLAVVDLDEACSFPWFPADSRNN